MTIGGSNQFLGGGSGVTRNEFLRLYAGKCRDFPFFYFTLPPIRICNKIKYNTLRNRFDNLSRSDQEN